MSGEDGAGAPLVCDVSGQMVSPREAELRSAVRVAGDVEAAAILAYAARAMDLVAFWIREEIPSAVSIEVNDAGRIERVLGLAGRVLASKWADGDVYEAWEAVDGVSGLRDYLMGLAERLEIVSGIDFALPPH